MTKAIYLRIPVQGKSESPGYMERNKCMECCLTSPQHSELLLSSQNIPIVLLLGST